MGCKLFCCYFGGGGDRYLRPDPPLEERTTDPKKDSPAQCQQEIPDPDSQKKKQPADQESSQKGSPEASSSIPMMTYPKQEKGQSSKQHQSNEDRKDDPSAGCLPGKMGPEETFTAAENPPPYHNWQEEVPDTAMFPPPPAHAYLYSNAGNASAEDADRAHEFCDNTPLWIPLKPSAPVYDCVRHGDLRPVRPQEYSGELNVTSNGQWQGSTYYGQRDCALLTGLPLYFAAEDSPLLTECRKTIYFEVKLVRTYDTTPSQKPGFSIGYAAQPYPTWRAPGWERGSVGVFSDDGCRFVNDSWGGREFTPEFEHGETVGLGMTFSVANDLDPNDGVSSPLAVEVFFTRNGRKAGSWDLHEEVDTDSGGVDGLEGYFDLYGAVGLFGGVEFEACFDQAGWLYREHL